MPTQQEVFDSIVQSARAGAASAGGELAESAVEALKSRYFDWIVTPGRDENGKETQTPQEVWDGASGEMLRGKFRDIGRLAAQDASAQHKQQADGVDVDAAADRVEADSMCDWCRP